MNKFLSMMMLVSAVACGSPNEPIQDADSTVQNIEASAISKITATDDVVMKSAFVADAVREAKSTTLSAQTVKKLYLSLAFNYLCPPVPVPGVNGWGVDDEAGNTNTQGRATACRAGILQSYMTDGKSYKLSHVFDENSPHSAFADPNHLLQVNPNPTFCLDTSNFAYDTNFCGHSEWLTGEFGSEGTQLDFFGHAGLRATPSTPKVDTEFYNGFLADEVFDGALSAPTIKPLNTIGILLDAKKHNGGVTLGPDDVVTVQDVQDMLVEQDLDWLGLQPGMVVFIYTGKGDSWGVDPYYYYAGPGLRIEVVEQLYKPNHIVMHGLDNPFSDQANLFTFQFLSGNDPLDPFPVHTHTLTAGILQGQNFNLTKLAQDKVYLFSVQLSPPQIAKAKGSMVTPQVFGSPWL